MPTLKLITHYTASGVPQTGLATGTMKVIDSTTAGTLASGPLVELTDGFYYFNYEAYTAGDDFLTLADSGSALSDSRYLADANMTSVHNEVWQTTVSGLGHDTSYGDQLEDVYSVNTGRWEIDGLTLNLYEKDGTTVLQAFTLDSSTSPTDRVPV